MNEYWVKGKLSNQIPFLLCNKHIRRVHNPIPAALDIPCFCGTSQKNPDFV